ncbi:hypothetical protein [Roseomonas indoligenes]|uniref:Uncharacterized protein n=1 Tax=Roseomonas indoligenes TaxID=2820811 RepID=A0A940MVS1_9PROT|nr:hypothetical protein [Pararoseomonas indoligenes]MBP0492122.1 hypothetical protein [Pararoseomonas indoligenes]
MTPETTPPPTTQPVRPSREGVFERTSDGEIAWDPAFFVEVRQAIHDARFLRCGQEPARMDNSDQRYADALASAALAVIAERIATPAPSQNQTRGASNLGSACQGECAASGQGGVSAAAVGASLTAPAPPLGEAAMRADVLVEDGLGSPLNMGSPDAAARDLAEKTAAYRALRQPMMGDVKSLKKRERQEREALFQLGGAALHWLWHREHDTALSRPSPVAHEDGEVGRP